MVKRVLVFAFCLMPVFSVVAEDNICSGTARNMPASTPTTPRFEFAADSETVVDKQTGLKWARCQWGYTFDIGSSSCVSASDETMTWKQALIIVKEDPVYLGEQGWRLPNIKELASIIEYKCIDPAINNVVFPGTRSGAFWSNTHIVNDKSSAIRAVNFAVGEVGSESPSNIAYLRLVKDAE